MIIYIPSSLSEDDFLQMFLQIGPICDHCMPRNEDGTPKGFGFVTFENPEDAARAVALYNGYNFEGKRLKVHYSRPGGRRINCNIFTTHLPSEWTTKILYQRFGDFGELLDVKILRHLDGSSRLCGFARFEEPESAQAAIEAYDGFRPHGAFRPIKVRLAHRQEDFWKAKGIGAYSRQKKELLKRNGFVAPQKKAETLESPALQALQKKAVTPQELESETEEKLFLCNLPTFFSEYQIKNICGRYGAIVDFTLQKSNTDVSLGMCFITYATKGDLKKACTALNGCHFCEQEVAARIL